MQNELNTSLIEAVKEKLPLKENLANLLIDTLYTSNPQLSSSASFLRLNVLSSLN